MTGRTRPPPHPPSIPPGRPDRVSVLMVCLGNICRSPMAEGVLRHLAAERGLEHRVLVDSAGTGGWHVGDPPDPRAVERSARRGVVLDHLRARQFVVHDFEWFDLIVAMDGSNERNLRRHARGPVHEQSVRRLREFDPNAGPRDLDVADPFYGDARDFDAALDVIWPACEGLLEYLVARGGW